MAATAVLFLGLIVAVPVLLEISFLKSVTATVIVCHQVSGPTRIILKICLTFSYHSFVFQVHESRQRRAGRRQMRDPPQLLRGADDRRRKCVADGNDVQRHQQARSRKNVTSQEIAYVV